MKVSPPHMVKRIGTLVLHSNAASLLPAELRLRNCNPPTTPSLDGIQTMQDIAPKAFPMTAETARPSWAIR